MADLREEAELMQQFNHVSITSECHECYSVSFRRLFSQLKQQATRRLSYSLRRLSTDGCRVSLL